MKEIKTGKIYLTHHAVNLLGQDLARAGHDIRCLHTEAQIMNAFLDTLSDEARSRLHAELDRRAVPEQGKAAAPSR